MDDRHFSTEHTNEQGKVKWYMKILNFCLCASSDPHAPKMTCKKKCIECMKPTSDDAEVTTTEAPRESWGNRCTFFITTLGMSVGLGQVWRFPNLAYAQGGGAFLIIYGIITFLFGNALFFFEVSNGQYSSKNPSNVFDKVPLFQGIGWAMIAYSYLFCTYYSHMVSYSMYYFIQSFRYNMPWTYCADDGFPDNVVCMPYSKTRKPELDGIICGNESFTFNRTNLCEPQQNNTYAMDQRDLCCKKANSTGDVVLCDLVFNISDICRPREYPSAYYWSHSVNRVFREGDPNYETIGEINSWLLVCSFVTWLLAFITLYKGLKSLGFVMYIIVPLPYIVLFIMLGVVIPQEGSGFGLKKFFVPRLKSFIDITVWRTATEQAFYSVGVAMGPLITFGSYSRFNNPSHIDGWLIFLCIFLTSVLCSLVVFSVLGFLTIKTGRAFEEVVEAGPGLVFIVYPESLELLPGAQFFSALFYLMLMCLGLSSVTGIIETVSSAIYDFYPNTRKYKYLINLAVLTSCFLIGIPMTARGGLVVYNAFDTYSAGIPLTPICVLELLSVIYFYGIGRFCEDINFMLGFYPNRYYRYNWLLAPFILFGIFIFGLVTLDPPFKKVWAKVLGWFLFLCVMIWIFVGMFYNMHRLKKQNNLKEIIKPFPDHGPKKEQDRENRVHFSVKRKIF